MKFVSPFSKEMETRSNEAKVDIGGICIFLIVIAVFLGLAVIAESMGLP